jgi:hypothetical protein
MTTVGPQTYTEVPLVIDASPIGGVLNMDGPVVGAVRYHQTPGDALVIEVDLAYGEDSETLEAFLVDGPSHALATGFITIGLLKTDSVGKGTATYTVPAGALEIAPFHHGYLTCHLDFLRGLGDLSGGIFTAGALNFFVCQGQRKLVGEEATRFQVHMGEPCGDRHRHHPENDQD